MSLIGRARFGSPPLSYGHANPVVVKNAYIGFYTFRKNNKRIVKAVQKNQRFA